MGESPVQDRTFAQPNLLLPPSSTMNLISAGLIKVQQLRVNQVRREVATLLQVSIHNIERVEFWAHQLWVKITGMRARLVSYRCLPQLDTPGIQSP